MFWLVSARILPRPIFAPYSVPFSSFRTMRCIFWEDFLLVSALARFASLWLSAVRRRMRSPRRPTKRRIVRNAPLTQPLPYRRINWVETGRATTGRACISHRLHPTIREIFFFFLFKAQHEWKGLYDGGTLTFRRTPTVAEMSPVAPIWARLAVLGKIEWKLVLKPHQDCAGLVLEGDWFPGELKFKEIETTDGKVASETASVIGIGTPIHLIFRKSAPSHLFLYAVTAHGLLNIDELFPGVATIIEVQFDSPSATREWPVTVAVGDNKLQLVARRNDQRGYIFRTDAFVPKSAAVAKDQVFDPSPKKESR